MPSRSVAWVVLAASVAPSIAGCGGGGGDSSNPHASSRSTSHVPTLVARLTPWRLPGPVSGEVVLSARGRLLLIGGLDSAGASTSGVSSIDPDTGEARPVGTLAMPLHDAAGALLHRRVFVFGGGDIAT